MSGLNNDEAITYIREISRLQDKIKKIEKTRDNYDTFMYNNNADQNMTVLRSWLENKEQLKHDKQSQIAYDNFIYYKKREKQVGHEIRLLRCSGLREHRELYNEFKKKYNEAMLTFYKYHGVKGTSVRIPSGNIYINEVKIERPEKPAFHEVNKKGQVLRIPSEFMNDFIQATYGLFQNQQQRIEELEANLLL